MLVLTRGKDESLILLVNGQEIKVKVLKCGSKTRLGIDAPKHVEVFRAEVIERLKVAGGAA